MRIGLVNDLHWMHEPPASPAAWHNPGEFEGVLDRLQLALERFAAQEVDLVVAAGDFAHHGDIDSIAHTLQALASAGAPVLVVSGNHDVSDDVGLLERALEHADVEGVALASETGSLVGGVRVAGMHVDASEGWFGVRARELPDVAAWAADPVLLISHYPALSLATPITASGFPYPGDLLDRDELADRLGARCAPTVVVSGHVHARACATEGPVLQFTNAAMVEPPYECSVIDVERSDGGLKVRRECIRLGKAATHREPVFCPSSEEWSFYGLRWSPNWPLDSQRAARDLPPSTHRSDPDTGALAGPSPLKGA